MSLFAKAGRAPGRQPRLASTAGVSAAEDRGARGMRPSLAGKLALFVLAAMAAAPLGGALIRAAGDEGAAGLARALGRSIAHPTTLRALAFGLKEAAASALLALLFGIPGAYLTARYEFPGRRLLKALAAVPFCVPPILVVLAFVLYFGRNGYLNRTFMTLFGLSEPPLRFLYSFWGLVLVHGFYNFPIVLAGVGEVLGRLPRDRAEAARTLGAGRFRAAMTGLVPSLAPAIVQSMVLVFLFSFFSFVVVLVFGPLGGSTLEVEVYRAARMLADERQAAALALIETTAALFIVLVLSAAERRSLAAARKGGSALPRLPPRGGALIALIAYGLFLLVFFVGPLAALIAEAFSVRRGMGGSAELGLGNFARLVGTLRSPGPLIRAIRDSLASALPAALLATALGGAVALLLRTQRSALAEAVLSLPLAVSGVVLALGWSFLVPSAVFLRIGRGLVILVEALAALPFVERSVAAALASVDRSPSLAARSLGASRLRAALDVDLASVAPALGSAAAFAFSMASGDASTPLLVAAPGFEPLPLLIFRLVSAYRFPEACAAGLILALIAGLVFFLKDREALCA